MTNNPREVFFEVERSELNELSAEGITGIPAKPFYACLHALDDDTVYHLSWGTFPAEDRVQEAAQRTPATGTHPLSVWQPDVEVITFCCGPTDRVSRTYLGMEFTDWAPGWRFLRLGRRPT